MGLTAGYFVHRVHGSDARGAGMRHMSVRLDARDEPGTADLSYLFGLRDGLHDGGVHKDA